MYHSYVSCVWHTMYTKVFPAIRTPVLLMHVTGSEPMDIYPCRAIQRAFKFQQTMNMTSAYQSKINRVMYDLLLHVVK